MVCSSQRSEFKSDKKTATFPIVIQFKVSAKKSPIWDNHNRLVDLLRF